MSTTRARAPPGRKPVPPCDWFADGPPCQAECHDRADNLRAIRRFTSREENMTEAVKLRRPEEEMLRWLLRRADALNAAYMAVELEEWGYPEAKAEMLETLEDMREQAHEWFETYRRALGIPDPLA